MHDNEMKQDMYKMLRQRLKDKGKKDMYKSDDMVKATIIADSPEGIVEGAEKLPEIMSKAEKFMEARSKEKKPKKK